MKGKDVPFYDSDNFYETDDAFDALEIVKDLPTIQSCARKQYGNDDIILNSYDDVNIDVDNNFNVD